jgi:nucleotide-binding universal stress UspA family protein
MANEHHASMNVVVGVDGSSGAEVAVRGVIERPWPRGTQFRVLTVMRPYLPVPSGFAASVMPPETYAAENAMLAEHARAWSEHAADTLKQAGLSAEPLVRYGDPRSEIVDEASSSSADLVVVGSHGRTGLKRLLMGSVAESVVRHAPCSVEVVREKTA